MNVVAFNGSPRKDGNTTTLINQVLKELDREGIETRSCSSPKGDTWLYQLLQVLRESGPAMCREEGRGKRVHRKDDEGPGHHPWLACLLSGRYRGNEGLIDRAGFVGLRTEGCTRTRSVRRSRVFVAPGGMNTIESMNHLFLSNDIIIAGRVLGVAREKGDMEKDEEGMQIATTLGQRMAWMLKKLHG